MSAPSVAISSPPPKDVLPGSSALLQAAKLSMAQDKPIQLDYYADSVSGKAYIGEDSETGEKSLIKTKEEFTSHIQKVYGVSPDYIVMTENSIYIVSGTIKKRPIPPNFLISD